MTTATKNLEDDHIHIIKLTEIMDQMTYDPEPEVSNLENIVDIIRNFADGIHHYKEEDIFFPFLSQRGFSNSAGPIAVMLHEHVIGRNLVRGISDNIALYKQGDMEALKRIYKNMNEYAELLRSHISKENNILFRMAERILSSDDQRDLLLKFRESKKTGTEEYIKMIDNLAVLYTI